MVKIRKISIILICLFSFFTKKIFAEIKIKIVEPMRFEEIGMNRGDRGVITGNATIEIYGTDAAEDIGKRIILEFPEINYMTNKQKWIKVEKIEVEENKKDFIMTRERQQIKIYSILDRSQFNRGEEIEIIEGEYIGMIPIIVSEYSRRIK